MDALEGLAKQASQITMYDLKSYYNQAKNMVLNVSEMEAKVREATNDDAWGASSTLMQEIAQGTHSFQQFNEIMPTIYSRFMEKEAREWRQIYKSLTLLEYLVKNGSERVVDDARSHISTIKMLRSFHYIDVGGKDQGINVRNRAKELSELLSDVDRIRSERRKAKSNRNKYQGVEGGGGFGGGGGGATFQSATGSRYGGFGSDSMGGGGGGGGYDSGDTYRNSSHHRSASGGQGGFDEYDAGDDEDSAPPPVPRPTSSSTAARRAAGGSVNRPGKQKEEEKPKEPAKVVDLFSFDEEDEIAAGGDAAAVGNGSLVDDDFDDFQAAPTPAPAQAKSANLFDMLDAPAAPVPAPKPAPMSMGSFTSPPAYANNNSFGMGMASPPIMAAPVQPTRPNYTSTTSQSSFSASQSAKPTAPKSAGGFDDLWTSSLSSFGAAPAATTAGSKSIKQLEQEKLNANLWGNGGGAAPTNGGQPKKPTMGAFEDLLG